MTRYLLLVAMLLLSACRVERTPRSQTQKPEDIARAVIADARAQLERALVDSDADGIASLFTPDGLYTRQGAGELSTPRVIRDDARAFFRDTTVTSISFQSDAVDVLPGGVAYELGSYTQTLQPADDSVRAVHGRYVIRWRRGPEASWRMERLLLTAR